MKKKLLLASLISLSCINIAKASCTPPTTLKCQCQHPIIDSNGKLACGEDYCAKNGKKCMPNGSCCEEAKFCGGDCCSENEICDTASNTCQPSAVGNCKGKTWSVYPYMMGTSNATQVNAEKAECEACGYTWEVITDFNDNVSTMQGCGGINYCKDNYGTTNWGEISKPINNTTPISVTTDFGCLGDDFCKVKYGASHSQYTYQSCIYQAGFEAVIENTRCCECLKLETECEGEYYQCGSLVNGVCQ